MKEEKLTVTEWAQKMAKSRADSLTPKRRSEIAKKAAITRWKKAKKKTAKKKGAPKP